METPLALTATETHSTRSMMTGCTVRNQQSNQTQKLRTPHLMVRNLERRQHTNQSAHRNQPHQPHRKHTGSRRSTVRRPQSMCCHQQHTQQRRRDRPRSRKSRRGCTGSDQSRTRTSTRVERFPPRRPRSSYRDLDRGTPSRSRHLIPPPSSATRRLVANHRLYATSPLRRNLG